MGAKERAQDLINYILLSGGIVTNLDNVLSLLLALMGIIYAYFRIRGAILDNKLKRKELGKSIDEIEEIIEEIETDTSKDLKP